MKSRVIYEFVSWQENVSLADILSLRDSCLTEQDIWAICLECCHSLKSIAHSAIFQTLCITPDTLAFNTNGNVCFMEQLSDDPEGAFVPPEFDITGNTFEAHIYSLGATLKAAIEYIVEPETESEFGQDLHTLLEQMQEENPENRPDIESILSLCEEKLKIASSSNICRSLSAVGRRVLSIESFGASQDVCDNMWKGRMCQRSLGSKLYSNEKNNIADDSESGLKEMQIDLDNEKTQHSQPATQPKKSKEDDKHAAYTDSFASVALDIKSCVIDLERDGIFKKGSLRKIKTFPKLPLEPADTNNFFTSVTNSGPLARKNYLLTQESLPLDNNNEVAFSKGNLNSFAISSPPKIEPKNHQVNDLHLEAPCVCTQVSGMNLEEHMSLINGKKIGFASSDHKEDCSDATSEMPNTAGMLKGPNQSIAGDLLFHCISKHFWFVIIFNNFLHPHSFFQWISLKILLSWYGKPLKDYELWALCHECLCTLQTCIDYPVVLCLDSVLIDCHGSILFAAPKVCVYGVAAVLWMAAKYSVPSSHKLALPRKLKKLLLDMARKNPEERPSLADAIKTCNHYLLERGINSKKILALLNKSVFKVRVPPFLILYIFSINSVNCIPVRFCPLQAYESKLVAVKGPVPCQISLNCEKATLPVAFTSPATHFKPIILQQNANITKLVHTPVSEQFKKETGKEKHMDYNKSGYIEDSKSYGTEDTDVVETAPQIPECDLQVPGHSAHISSEEQKSGNAFTSIVTLPSPSHFSHTLQGRNILPEVPSSSLACPTSPNFLHINNIILKQDSEKRVLTFVPVHLNRTSDTLLQEVVHLIQEEFAFDGYLENGVEVFDMGTFILNLKEIKFGMFSDTICEKFCDLYWDEKLLENLYQVVNGERPSHLCSSAHDHYFSPCPTPSLGEGEATFDVKAEPMINTSVAEMDFDESPSNNIKKELRLQNTIPIEKERQFLQSNGCCIRPGFAEETTEPEEETMIKIAGNSYLVSPSLPDFHGCSPGWSSAFYGAECFNSEVHSYMKNLGKQKSSESQNIDELEQLLMMETKNYRKTIKFYQKLLQKERRSKGPETKSMLSKLRGQLQEMKSKVQFLELVKKYMQIMYVEQWGVESCVLPTIIHNGRTDTVDVAPTDEPSLLLYYNTEKHQCNNQNGIRVLQAGTPLGLMAYLYSRNAFLEGYVQQFLYTFRYFCTQEEFLQFLLDRINSTLSSASLDPSTSLTKICNRSFYILQAWIEDCYSVDFATNTDLLCTLKEFISSKVAPLNGYGERLLLLLEDVSARKSGSAHQYSSMDRCEEEGEEDRKTLHSLCKKLSEDVSRKNFNWKLCKGMEPIAQYQRERLYTMSSVLPKPCYNSFTEEFPVSFAKADEVGPYLLIEYSAQQLCCQLTLLQQEVFHKCHPVHFLNSRALGVKDKCVAVQKAVSTEAVSLKVCNLFLSKCIQDQYLLQLLRNADSISTWVAAEIVTCHTSKLQVSLLSKFLLIAKCCYEQRNFATAMQILAGLENLIVRQLPAWKILPAKVAEIMEELKAVEVFLKSDSLCLMEGERFKTLPTIPSAHVLAMHVQQLETGGFTMTNGAHKWTKLRNIAKVVSQVHAFQENPYTYTPDFKLQSYLRQRITHFKDADISALAADNCANFHQIPAEKHSRKIQDALRRMKATFQ
uniref:Kinase non-catalytic C-lobe domain containing 1 n=1 Tax=Aquila chrysaetos chrysaetos TaxID=223781 RepID=A0A663DWA4_AQUCH